MPERVLVCILAEARAHELTWDNFKANVIDELSADLAVCIAGERLDESNPFYKNAKYRWTIPEFGDWGDAFDLAKKQVGSRKNWRQLLRIKDQWLGGIKGRDAHPGSAGILLFFRWLLQQKIIENELLSKYDRFIVTRSDFYYWCPHPPIDVLDRKYIWMPLSEDYGGFTDRHLVASAEDVIPCLDILSDVIRRPTWLYWKMRPYETWNLERYIRFQFGRMQLESRVRRFPYVMTAVRGEKDGTRWSVGVFDPTVGMIIKYPSEMQAASEYRARIRSASDWRSFYGATQFAQLVSPPADFSATLERPCVVVYGEFLYRRLKPLLRPGVRRMKRLLGYAGN